MAKRTSLILSISSRSERPRNLKMKAKCFFVPIEEIKANEYDLSISKCKEIEYEEVQYEKPEEIKKKILELEQNIVKTLEELEL
jgi:type I restriction enzyme M protein